MLKAFSHASWSEKRTKYRSSACATDLSTVLPLYQYDRIRRWSRSMTRSMTRSRERTRITAPSVVDSIRASLKLVSIWVLGLLQSSFAHGEDFLDMSMEELLNTTVYTASRFPQKSSDAPAAVSIITREDINTFGYQTLAEILASVRGLHGTYDRNYEYLGVRGLGRTGNYNNRFLLLIDGFRVNDAIYENAAIGRESFLDVSLIDRVEIVRGPGSSVHGSNAFLGVINVITRKGRDIDGLRLSLSGGSFGSRQGQLTFGRRFENELEILVSAGIYESGGQNAFAYSDPDFQIPEKQFGRVKGLDEENYHNIFGKFSYRDFTATIAFVDREKEVPTASFGAVINQPNEAVDRRFNIGLNYEYRLNDQVGLYVSGMYSQHKFKRESYYDRINEDLPPYSLNIDSSTANWWNTNARLDAVLGRNHLVVGVEFQKNTRQKLLKYDVNPAVVYLDEDRDSFTWALYVEDEIKLTDRVLINVGLRYDRYSNFGSSLNPRLAGIFSLSDRSTLKLLYGTAFRAPSEYELQPGVDRIASPDLKAEGARSFEVVFEHYFSPQTRLTLAAYQNQLTDLIELVDDVPADALIYRNPGSYRMNGGEIEFEHRFKGGQNLRLSYAVQDSKNEVSGSGLAASPRHLAKINVATSLFSDRIQAGLELQYSSAQKVIRFGQVDEEHPDFTHPVARAHTRVNVNLTSKRFDNGLQVKAKINDLFDQDNHHPGGYEHDMDLIDQDGRTFFLELNYRLGR